MSAKKKYHCSHSENIPVNRIRENYYGEDEHYVDYEERSTYVDIDLHRYKCTKCGEVGYYSGAAVDYYTKGIRSDIRGLQ